MRHCSALKAHELSSKEISRQCKCLLLSERSQSVKATYCVNSNVQDFRKVKTMVMIKRTGVERVRGEEIVDNRACQLGRGR